MAEYTRICDVPERLQSSILCPWEVQAISNTKPGIKTFQFELSYGAHPRYWPGWKDHPRWIYYRTVKRPEDFDVHFRLP